jgi:hypothetical protein
MIQIPDPSTGGTNFQIPEPSLVSDRVQQYLWDEYGSDCSIGFLIRVITEYITGTTRINQELIPRRAE